MSGIDIVLCLMWLLTAAFALSERQERRRVQKSAAVAETVTRRISERIRDRKTDFAVQSEIRPLVEAAKSFDMRGRDKRHRVLMGYLREYPGSSYRQAAEAIEAVLVEKEAGSI